MSNVSEWQNIRYDYAGAQVLVTGGTSGIGAGIAAAYRAAGAQVIVTGTRKAAADYDTDLKGYRYLQLSLTDKAQISAVANALSRLDILINNAGANFMLQNEYDPDIFEKGLQVNLASAYRLALACKPLLAASTLGVGASVVGLASLTSFFGLEVVPAYGAAKAGLVQLTKTLSISWAKDRIRVNAVAAGVTESRMTAQMLKIPAMMAPVLARTPLKRPGKPADVAGAVLFLTSGAAGYITGQTLLVDGGYSVVG
jgi:3-oxoacyl-[acyl-carrier protein] reductase